jgi:signal transduction histidine kinase
VLTRLHKSESVRLTAIVAAVIVGAMVVLMVPVYVIMRDAFRAELFNGVDQDISAIDSGYRHDGVGEAQEVISQQLANPRTRGFYVLVRLPDEKLAGNLPVMPQRLGSFALDLPPALLTGRNPGDHRILGKGVKLAPDLYLFAGRDSYVAIEAREHVLQTFTWVLFATLIVALGGGALVSRSVLGRMEAMTQTCHAIMAGKLTDRVPERGSEGEFDMLARTINAMLDRINALMENVQQVSNDIAHDLRTPLSRLHNRLELALSEAATTADYRQTVSDTMRECETILATFSSLLRIGQIEAAAGTAPSDPVDLSALLSELVEIYQPAAEDGEFTLRSEIAPNLVVHGDRSLLSQVFANLIENAMAHTPLGSTIGVVLAREGTAVVASVGDNGPGIPENEREPALRRFYRCERSRTSPGSGLGLSLVAAIARYHGATLALSDNLPGLRVTLRFPAAATDREPSP